VTKAKCLRFHLCQPPVPACSTCARQEDDMSLEKLMDTYDPLKGKETTEVKVEAVGLQSWKDSAPVVRLSEYLKKHKDLGIYLYQRNNRPYLFFDPGLTGQDRQTERWQIAFNTTLLFFEAADDLEYLIAKGLISIAAQPDRKPDDNHATPSHDHKIAAGPSHAS